MIDERDARLELESFIADRERRCHNFGQMLDEHLEDLGLDRTRWMRQFADKFQTTR